MAKIEKEKALGHQRGSNCRHKKAKKKVSIADVSTGALTEVLYRS